jgi:hypothetical protein
MYERPKLNVVGDAREVILGFADVGLDLDGTHYYPDGEYGNDSRRPSSAAGL